MVSPLAQSYGASTRNVPGWTIDSLGGSRSRSQSFGGGSGQPAPAPYGESMLNRQNSLDIANIGQTGARNQQSRFNTVFPWVKQQMGNMMGQFGSSVGGSQVGTQPQINANPIWGQRQIQQQVNSGVAGNDARLAGQNRQTADSLAARGFGAQSPLAMAMQQQAGFANNAANANVRRDIPWQSAQGNAQHLLQSQMAQESQFGNRQAEQVARAQTAQGFLNPLLGLLGSLGG